MSQDQLYEEILSSDWTQGLFVGLTIILGALLWNESNAGGPGVLIVIYFILTFLFLLYSLNYRTLKIRLDRQVLRLKFGVFSYTIPLENIQSGQLDELNWYQKYGGAGIHFMSVRGRYRASFNFLEYPRIVITLREKVGWVRDVSFSTRKPEKILSLLQHLLTAETDS